MKLGKCNPFTTKLVKTENQIEKEILDFLGTIKGKFWKNYTTGVYDPVTKKFRPIKETGASDILGIINGRLIAIEVKTPQNKKRPQHQKNFLEDINRNGGLGFFATSVNEVKIILEKNGLLT